MLMAPSLRAPAPGVPGRHVLRAHQRVPRTKATGAAGRWWREHRSRRRVPSERKGRMGNMTHGVDGQDPSAPTRPGVSGAVVHALVAYVGQKAGEAGVAQALALAAEERPFPALGDVTAWTSTSDAAALFAAGALVTGTAPWDSMSASRSSGWGTTTRPTPDRPRLGGGGGPPHRVVDRAVRRRDRGRGPGGRPGPRPDRGGIDG